MSKERLQAEAKRVLRGNRISDYTVPCKALYPFQWNWDAGFTCLGWSHIDIDLVVEEYRSLFRGQWKNGMIPHIIFHSKQQDGYFPNASYWQSGALDYSSDEVLTSGITQPPVHGFILEHLLKRHGNNKQLMMLAEELYPAIMGCHNQLYKDRDPQGEGLVYIYHPWESGRDNSPVWDEVLERIKVDQKELPHYKRVDNLKADPSHRPTDEDYMKYVYLMEIGRKSGYQGRDIEYNSPFLVQDTLFNAMLIASEKSLVRLGKMLGKNTTATQERLETSEHTYRNKLWNDALDTFVCYDLKTSRQMEYREIGGLAAMFAEVPDVHQSKLMTRSIAKMLTERAFYLQPSFDTEHSYFDPKRYWKGPVWPQMNWLIHHGLLKYQYIKEAETVKEDLLQLVSTYGFFEYFDPRIDMEEKNHRGYGGKDFSWTSAVILDFIS
ncbi:MAG: trehalase family glycosidase [Cyclobacteriaceae bacterium]